MINKSQSSFRIRIVLIFIFLFVAVFAGANSQTVFGRTSDFSYSCNDSTVTEADLAAYRGISIEEAQGLHSTGLVHFSDLCDISQASLDNALAVLQEIGSFEDFRLAQLQDENGEISAEAYLAAQDAFESMFLDSGLSAATAGIGQGSWNWIGPGNIGGRVRALAVHPSDPDIMWAGGIAGGIWKTMDGGASWQSQDEFLNSMSVTSIVVNPADPDVLFAGTGEGIGDDSNSISRWIYKTTDGGGTWTQLARTGAPATDTEHVHRLAISPNGDTLLAATEDGILRCSEANSDNYCEDVADWSLIYETGVSTSLYEVTDIDFRTAPDTTQTVVASGEHGLVIRSTDVKAGTPAWTEITLEAAEGVGMGRAEVAYADGSTVYVSAAIVDYLPSEDGAHIYKSEDDGATFLRKSPAGRDYLSDGNGNEANLLWVAPDDSMLIVGGEQLYRSTDSGLNITQISDSTQSPNSAFSFQHVAVSGSGDQLIVGTDGGVYRASDINTVTTTSGWTELNNNLGITEFYCVDVDVSGNMTGNTRNTGTIYHASGAGTDAWTQIADDDCTETINPDAITVPEPPDTITKVAHSSGSTYYATRSGYAKDNVWKTINNGASWTALGDLPIVMPVYDIVVDGSNVYIGTEFGVFATQDDGANWSLTYADGDSPTSSPVQDLDLMDGTTLIAATYGRGVFTAEIGDGIVRPANDDFDNAMDLSTDINDAINGEGEKSMPYTVEYAGGITILDTTNATTAGDDPAAAACDISPGTATVWYEYNPGGADMALVFDTLGSDYDTYIAVWKGDRGNLELVGCNNDIDESENTSRLTILVSGNDSYYIQVGQYNGN